MKNDVLSEAAAAAGDEHLTVSGPRTAAPPAPDLRAGFLRRVGSPDTPTFLLTNSGSRRS